jgi:endonuclease/exonuclease/phosphatase family metal-dependent hydrolase
VFRHLRSRFRDAQTVAQGHRPRPTFSSLKPLLRLDHVFVSPHFVVRSVDLPDTPTARVASDHLPLCVELQLHPDHETV